MRTLTVDDEMARERAMEGASRGERPEEGLDPYCRARLALLGQRPDLALTEIEGAKDPDPATQALQLRILAMRGARPILEVEQRLDALVEDHPYLIGPTLQRGFLSLHSGDVAHAARLARDLVARFPESWDCRLLLASAYRMGGYHGEALRTHREYRQLGGPGTPDVLQLELWSAAGAKDRKAVVEAYRLSRRARGRFAWPLIPQLAMTGWARYAVVVLLGVLGWYNLWALVLLAALMLVWWGAILHVFRPPTITVSHLLILLLILILLVWAAFLGPLGRL